MCFDVERQKVIADQLAQGRSQQDAERRADDADYYERAFFVPPEARWEHLRDNVHHQVGDGLNKALAALETHNPALEGVLQHINFNRRVGTTMVTDKKWRDLIDHFSKYRLRNEDFEFPDLLGAGYEYQPEERPTPAPTRSTPAPRPASPKQDPRLPIR